jgi:hypothetical protein
MTSDPDICELGFVSMKLGGNPVIERENSILANWHATPCDRIQRNARAAPRVLKTRAEIVTKQRPPLPARGRREREILSRPPLRAGDGVPHEAGHPAVGHLRG